MEIIKFEVGPLPTNAYLVVKGKDCVLIDGGSKAVIDYIKEKKLKLSKILLTHGHGDHLFSVMQIKKEFGAKIYVSKKDKDLLNHPFNLNLFNIKGVKADEVFERKVDNFLVLETPGHTLGSVCFYDDKAKVLFSGDTLFCKGIGRVDFPHSDPALMKKSIKKLMSLSFKVKVYPGHGPVTTMADEVEHLESVLDNYLKEY